ncbi:hypothetical protein [Streptomyces tsukubensis]|uniref:hypothetical protein n=1 Tax=Streptomyces tsukubensis TaxID=83656 RepID=UPI00344C2DE2
MDAALRNIVELYEGLIHGDDLRGNADVEFPDAHKAAAFATNYLSGQVMMRQEWAPGVDGYSVNIDFPVVLTFRIDRFSA